MCSCGGLTQQVAKHHTVVGSNPAPPVGWEKESGKKKKKKSKANKKTPKTHVLRSKLLTKIEKEDEKERTVMIMIYTEQVVRKQLLVTCWPMPS